MALVRALLFYSNVLALFSLFSFSDEADDYDDDDDDDGEIGIKVEQVQDKCLKLIDYDGA